MENSQKYPEHIFKFRVPISYIDLGGVIYNGRYLDIYNQARDEHMRDIGYTYMRLNTDEQYHLTVAQTNIQYKAPVFYDDNLNIVTRVEKIGSSSISFDQTIYKNSSNTFCNHARSVLVCIGTGFKPKPIPRALIDAYQNGPS